MTLNARSGDDSEYSAKLTVRDLAKQALAHHDGDWQKASEQLYKWALDDYGVLYTLTAHLVWQACKDAVRGEGRSERSEILASSSGKTADKLNRDLGGKRLGKYLQRYYLDMPLPGGKKLREATGYELEKHASDWHKQARTMEKRANWLRAVSLKAGERRVGDVLSEDDVRKLWDEC